MDDLIIRKFRHDDTQPTAQVFFDAVRFGAAEHYTQNQRDTWAPCVPEPARWQERLSTQTVFVAEHQGRLIGFMTLTPKGCIDLAFVAPDYMGRNVAHQLYDEIVRAAKSQGLNKLTTEASDLARPFFERHAWVVVKEQSVSIGEIALTNFLMTKEI